MSGRGRPRKWIDKYDVDFGRLVLQCKLIDRILGDKIIGQKVLRKPSVPLRDTFWICDSLIPAKVGKALTMSSEDISSMLIHENIKRSLRRGSRLRDFYYTWHKPSKTVVRTVGHRIDVLRSLGQTLWGAIEIVATEGLHPGRRTNKQLLPPVLIRNLYRCHEKS